MTTKLLLLALLPLAYAGQVASVDLSKEKVPSSLPEVVSVRGGGILGRGQAHKPPEAPPIRLVLTRMIARSTGILTRYSVEVVMTNTGNVPMSIPIGTDTDSLLAPTQHDRSALEFTSALATSGKLLMQSGVASASSSEHPESSAALRPGDSVVFLLPVGMWRPDKAPTEEISVSVQRQRKVVEGGTDWTDSIGPKIRSENSLPLPPSPAPETGR
jgi:hypothetical protein